MYDRPLHIPYSLYNSGNAVFWYNLAFYKMTYNSRKQAILAYLRKNEELLENMERGRVEINFSGKNMAIRTVEMAEEVKIEFKSLTTD